MSLFPEDTNSPEEQVKLTPDEVEEVSPGLQCEWYLEKQIVVYTLFSMSPELLAVWSKKALEVIENWPKDAPYLAMHDISNQGCGLAYIVLVQYQILNIGVIPDLRQRAEEVVKSTHQHQARVAINLSRSSSGRLGKVFARLDKSEKPSIEYGTFFERQRALRWLKNSLEDDTDEDKSIELLI